MMIFFCLDALLATCLGQVLFFFGYRPTFYKECMKEVFKMMMIFNKSMMDADTE